MTHNSIMVTNVTGEPFMPARIYYSVADRPAVLAALKKLRCVNHDPPNARWVWLWDAEAKGLTFLAERESLPKKVHPIVIGSFTFRGEHQMLLELRSFSRVLHALPFFERWVGPSLARATRLRIVNRLLSPNDAPTPGQPLDEFFDRKDVQVTGGREVEEEMRRISAKNYGQLAKVKALLSLLEKFGRRKTPAIEELDLSTYHEDGIEGLQLRLKLRELEAMEHWNGNTDITPLDLMERILRAGGGPGA